jgi:hypothetical protein
MRVFPHAFRSGNLADLPFYSSYFPEVCYNKKNWSGKSLAILPAGPAKSKAAT